MVRKQVKVTESPLQGVYIIDPALYEDDRGYFMETYNQQELARYGMDMVFVQDNQSMSVKGVLRGLHYQRNYSQGKLVRAVKGRIFDVAVDLRNNSSTFGKWFGIELTERNKKQLYISRGFAHGFLVLSDIAEICYKVTDYYHPEEESGLAWNDPELGVSWPEVEGVYRGSAAANGYTLSDGTPLLLSKKDQEWPGLKEAFRF